MTKYLRQFQVKKNNNNNIAPMSLVQRQFRKSLSYFFQQMCGDSFEMREMAARICRDYLHGAWQNVTPQNIGFKHIR